MSRLWEVRRVSATDPSSFRDGNDIQGREIVMDRHQSLSTSVPPRHQSTGHEREPVSLPFRWLLAQENGYVGRRVWMNEWMKVYVHTVKAVPSPLHPCISPAARPMRLT